LNDPEANESKSIQVGEHDFVQMLHHHHSESLLVDLSVDDGAARKVLLREVQHDPLTGGVLHADFLVVSMTKKMRATVSVTLVGESKGVHAGGVLDQALHELEIECLPTDLPEELEADVSGLGIGDSLLVSEIVAPEAVEIVTPADLPVASVLAPRLEEEEAEEEEGAEGAKEPELVGKEEEEESDEGEGKD
jgi:large subunit ribosomal protein L25